MRKLLVVVDMQKDFVDGALGTKEAQAVVPAVVKKIGEYASEDIFVTRDTHQSDYMTTQEGKNLPVEHCIEGSAGWQIDAEVQKALDSKKDADKITYVNKPTFGSVDLAAKIKEIAAKEEISVELIGVCTDICVVSNALLIKANLPEINISVDASCCAGVTSDKHKAALETMSSCQIAIIE
ncbi:cysteine hydrolase [Butyrivibrio sp. X503]|uniref:cysteine hydrolase family protein n=1 Tax=Butyrivibrio sp. X503 TaxID=2364878 RepID=UPI000EA9BA7B|nr:isochorismatase family cysteine hydrolase [Butyrivibrio sp. X503]RKM54138.1 cysteine hydrolase [Butyrivibrio sp. X503]